MAKQLFFVAVAICNLGCSAIVRERSFAPVGKWQADGNAHLQYESDQLIVKVQPTQPRRLPLLIGPPYVPVIPWPYWPIFLFKSFDDRKLEVRLAFYCKYPVQELIIRHLEFSSNGKMIKPSVDSSYSEPFVIKDSMIVVSMFEVNVSDVRQFVVQFDDVKVNGNDVVVPTLVLTKSGKCIHEITTFN